MRIIYVKIGTTFKIFKVGKNFSLQCLHLERNGCGSVISTQWRSIDLADLGQLGDVLKPIVEGYGYLQAAVTITSVGVDIRFTGDGVVTFRQIEGKKTPSAVSWREYIEIIGGDLTYDEITACILGTIY